MKVVALVGMAGSGKSEVARFFEKNGLSASGSVMSLISK